MLTANDVPRRDPTSWSFEGLSADGTWETLQSISNEQPPSGRYTLIAPSTSYSRPRRHRLYHPLRLLHVLHSHQLSPLPRLRLPTHIQAMPPHPSPPPDRHRAHRLCSHRRCRFPLTLPPPPSPVFRIRDSTASRPPYSPPTPPKAPVRVPRQPIHCLRFNLAKPLTIPSSSCFVNTTARRLDWPLI